MNFSEFQTQFALYATVYLVFFTSTLVHELGHYWAARWQGVAVKTFRVGMAPVLFRREWRGTQWELGLLPLGGFVQLDGMKPDKAEDGTELAPHGYRARPAWGRLVIMAAGVFMNLCLALMLLTALVAHWGVPVPDRVRVETVLEGSVAGRAGFQVGDLIVALDGQKLPTEVQEGDTTLPGWTALDQSLIGEHDYTVQRADREFVITVNWDEEDRTGINYSPAMQPVSFPVAALHALKVTGAMFPLLTDYIVEVVKRFATFNLGSSSGLGEVMELADSLLGSSSGLLPLLLKSAAILNLAVLFFNLLPIPNLDGGRIIMILWGVVFKRGHPLDSTWEFLLLLPGALLLLVFYVWQLSLLVFGR